MEYRITANIIDHEFAHVLEKEYQRTLHRSLEERVTAVMVKKAKEKGIPLNVYIKENVSKYAVTNNEKLSELFARAFGNEPILAKEILREAKVL